MNPVRDENEGGCRGGAGNKTPLTPMRDKKEGTGLGGEGGTQVMHGRSLGTVDPRIPTISGRNTSGFHRPGRP